MKLLKLKKFFWNLGFVVEIVEDQYLDDFGNVNVIFRENLINIDIGSRKQILIFSIEQKREFPVELRNEFFHINCVRCLFDGQIFWMPLNQFEEIV